MSGATTLQQRHAELVAAVATVERLSTLERVQRVPELVSRLLALTGELVHEVTELQREVASLSVHRDWQRERESF